MALSDYEFCRRQVGRSYGCHYTVKEVSQLDTMLVARTARGAERQYLITNDELRALIEVGFIQPYPEQQP